MTPFPPQDFYDQLAEDYHLIYSDWSQAVSRQGNALDALIRGHLWSAEPLDVLDVSCGLAHRRSV